MVHSGWKEISDYLHCGARTAQRWENRAHCRFTAQFEASAAMSSGWIRGPELLKRVPGVVASNAKAQKLRREARTACVELRARVQTLRQEMSTLLRNAITVPALQNEPVTKNEPTRPFPQVLDARRANSREWGRVFRPRNAMT